MTKRAQILGFLAAAVQKNSGTGLAEAIEHFSEAVVSMTSVLDRSGSRLESCVLAKVWMMRSSSEADRAAVVVMLANQKRKKWKQKQKQKQKQREPKKRETQRKDTQVQDSGNTASGVNQLDGSTGANKGIAYFVQALETYVEAHAASLKCHDNGRITMSVRVGWINARINLARAYISIGHYDTANNVLRWVVGKDQEKDAAAEEQQPTCVTKADARSSRAMAALFKRANQVLEKLNQKMNKLRNVDGRTSAQDL